MVFVQLVMVDAVGDGQVGAVGGGRDDHLLGAGRQVGRRLVAGGEDAGAFERDVDAEILPGKLGRILDRGDLELLLADGDRIAVHSHFMRETAMHAVVAQQVRVGLDGAEIVDGDHVDVLASGLVDGADDVAADAAESVDCNSDSHVVLLQRLGRCRRFNKGAGRKNPDRRHQI